MNTFQPSRFDHSQPMLLAGLRRHHAYAEAAQGIPAQWQAFVGQCPLPNQTASVTYGVICGHDASQFEYMTAVEVSSFDGLPEEMGRMRIENARYAVFLHSGNISDIRTTWQQIHDWLLHSQYASANKADFERYDERFDPKTGTGEVELWVAVVHRTD